MSGRSAEAHARVVEEIAREKAATLGRAGDRLEAALAEVAEIARAWPAAEDARARASCPPPTRVPGTRPRRRGRRC